jgi:hypothetical protein
MSAAFVAALSAGGLNPLSLTVLGTAGAQLSANLTAALSLEAQVSVGATTLATQLVALLEAAAAIEIGIAQGLPGITFSVSAAAQLVAAAQLGLGLLGELTVLLGGPAMYVYKYSGGTVSTIGSDLSTAITGHPPPGLTGASACTGLLVGAGATVWASGISPYFGSIV